jgi:hypothetical protein
MNPVAKPAATSAGTQDDVRNPFVKAPKIRSL